MVVYVNEDLTKSRNELIRKARMMVKLKYIKSAWSSDGTILVRLGDEAVHRINRKMTWLSSVLFLLLLEFSSKS